MAKKNQLNDLGVEWLCSRIIDGYSQTAIAREMGIGVSTLSDWIAGDPERSAHVREARVSAARTFSEKAEIVIAEASDPFALAKAKELAHHYRWQASKASPREYGDKIEIEQKTTLTDLTDEQLNERIAKLSAAAG